MRRYRYRYNTVVHYDSMVSRHHFMLRCTPLAEQHQRVLQSDLQLLSAARVDFAFDCFGNVTHYGSVDQPHDIFVVASNGMVVCDDYRIADINPNRIFAAESAMTHSTPEIRAFNNSLSLAGSDLERATQMAEAIYSTIKYSPSTTTTETTAGEAFSIGCGVCQDLAHIMITMCRANNIPSRYVAGLLVGTGETHAWVEIYSDGAWWGIDPTHQCVIEYGYIKLAHGRDASDCSVIRGMHRGVAHQMTQVRVVVEEI